MNLFSSLGSLEVTRFTPTLLLSLCGLMIIQIFMFEARDANIGSMRRKKQSQESAKSFNLSGKSILKFSSASQFRYASLAVYKCHLAKIKFSVFICALRSHFLSELKIQLLLNVTRFEWKEKYFPKRIRKVSKKSKGRKSFDEENSKENYL